MNSVKLAHVGQQSNFNDYADGELSFRNIEISNSKELTLPR